ncbi:MAG: GldG family protein [Planctomycetes bacterium]|nr:GldG family protein [Planctomycetota bacterium]
MSSERMWYAINAIIGSIAILLVLVLVNFVATSPTLKARMDLTEDSRFTLDPMSADVLSQLDDYCTLRFAYDDAFGIELRKVVRDIIDKLDEMKAVSNDRLKVELYDMTVEDRSDEERLDRVEKLAEQYGFPRIYSYESRAGQRTQVTGYFGLSIEYQGRMSPVYVRNAETEDGSLRMEVEMLEYDIVSTIYGLAVRGKNIVAVATPNSLFSSWSSATGRFDVVREFNDELERMYDVRDVSLNNKDAWDVLGNPLCKVLMIVFPVSADQSQPSNPMMGQQNASGTIDTVSRFHIDQFIMRGGAVVVLGNNKDLFSSAGGSAWNVPSVNNGLSELLDHFGLKIGNDIVLEDSNHCREMRMPIKTGNTNVMADVPLKFYLTLDSTAFVSDDEGGVDSDVVTFGKNDFEGYFLSSVTSTVASDNDRVRFRPIVTTSANASTKEGDSVFIDASELASADFQEENVGRKHLVAMTAGEYTSFFEGTGIPDSVVELYSRKEEDSIHREEDLESIGESALHQPEAPEDEEEPEQRSFTFYSRTPGGTKGRVVVFGSLYYIVTKSALDLVQNVIDDCVFRYTEPKEEGDKSAKYNLIQLRNRSGRTEKKFETRPESPNLWEIMVLFAAPLAFGGLGIFLYAIRSWRKSEFIAKLSPRGTSQRSHAEPSSGEGHSTENGGREG